MITEPCLAHLDLKLEETYEQMESYEHLGEIKTINIDMHRRYDALKEARRVFLTEKDADIQFTVDFPTPPPVTWEWIQDPRRRNSWGGGVHWYSGDRPKGRTGNGASNHCAHGKSVSTEVTLDWRPFDYSTVDSFETGKKMFSENIRLEPLPNGGTRVHDYSQLHLPLPGWIRKIMAKAIMIYHFKYDKLLRDAAQLAGEEYQRSRPMDQRSRPADQFLNAE